jgi:hypothetical protein
MKYEMEFDHTTLEDVEKVLRKRYLGDVPNDFGLPLRFETPLLFRYEDHSADRTSRARHKVIVELFREEPYLVLSLNVSIHRLYLIFGLILIGLLGFSQIVLGNWIWIFLFAFSFLFFFWEYYQRLSMQFENYCEKLKKEIIG